MVGDNYVDFLEHGPEMEVSMAAAVSTLGEFWARVEDPESGADEFSLKAGLDFPSGGVEHIWTTLLARRGERFAARLANDPMHLRGLRNGSQVIIEVDRICDWSYRKNGKTYGAFTTRVLLPYLSPAERAGVEADLAPTPLEDGQH